MTLLPRLLFLLLLVVTAVVIWTTSAWLPERVATHFGTGGVAGDWMPRDGYLAFMLGFAMLLPILGAVMIGWMPRIAPSRAKIPHRDYWLAPARRTETLATLADRGFWLGCLLAVFMLGMHGVVVQANRASPPQLPALSFWSLVAFLLVGVGIFVLSLHLRFRRPD